MIGKILAGQYQIDSFIGSGGMANVYKAHSIANQKIYAIKMMKEEFKDDREFVRRFKREALAVLSLLHENIVRSYEVGEEDGLYFIVMEYVEGFTLKDMIKRQGSLAPKVASNIACQVLEALAVAHSKSIIHRDVKPQNIIVTAKLKAKLADFGIARDAASSTVTFAGNNVLGSVHYISPEQAQGETVGAESDIYSMGIILYEMLTGRVPFSGDNTVAVALKHLQEDVIPPKLLNKSIPTALNDIVMKAVAKDPARRYQTAKDMRHDIIRAQWDPEGDFVKTDKLGKKAKKRKATGIWRAGLSALIAVGLFTMMFFIGRSIWQSKNNESTDRIPMLVGKTLEEAKQLAKIRGYNVEVDQWLNSEEYSDGVVMAQLPESGMIGVQGSIITVDVSLGSKVAIVPDVKGLDLKQAELALTQAKLKLGEVEYQLSEQPAGQVFRQNPEQGSELVAGDVVDIWISGEPNQMIEMPSLGKTPLPDALAMIRERGFEKIRIRTDNNVSTDKNALVLTQSPSPGMSVTKSTLVELTVAKPYNNKEYTSDIAYNIDVLQGDSKVIVCAKISGDMEMVLYESLLPAGKQVVSFTATYTAPGDYECILYLNDKPVITHVETFNHRNLNE